MNLLEKIRAVAIKANEDNKCQACGEPFTNKNVFTGDGWREVKVSGCCEKCFDEMFTDEE